MKWEYSREIYLKKYCMAQGLSGATVATYAMLLDEFRKYFDECGKVFLINELKTADICDYIEYLKIKKLNGQATVGKKVTVLRSYFKALVALKILDHNQDPCVGLMRMRKAHETIGDILSMQEIERLTNAPNRDTLQGLRDRAILLLLCTTGIRASECANLRDCDIDTSNKMLRIFGKGGRQRVVMMNEIAFIAMENYLKFRGNQAEKEFSFRVRTGREMNRKRIFDIVKYYISKVRITKKISPHRLRHSFANRMLDLGIELATLKELLGHRCLQSTMRYIQISGEALRAAVNKLEMSDAFEKVVAMLPLGKIRYQKPRVPILT